MILPFYIVLSKLQLYLVLDSADNGDCKSVGQTGNRFAAAPDLSLIYTEMIGTIRVDKKCLSVLNSENVGSPVKLILAILG